MLSITMFILAICAFLALILSQVAQKFDLSVDIEANSVIVGLFLLFLVNLLVIIQYIVSNWVTIV